MNINLKSVFLCSKAVVPGMKAAGGGRIINFADWIAASGRPRYTGYLPYYVSKVGVVGLTEILALELAPHNILVNAIAPGPILAPPDLTEEEDAEVRKATPLGRWGGENEIAKAVVSLVETDFITGECIGLMAEGTLGDCRLTIADCRFTKPRFYRFGGREKHLGSCPIR